MDGVLTGVNAPGHWTIFRRAMNLSRLSRAARTAALSLLALLVLAPAAHARKPATLSTAGRDPDVAVDSSGTGHFVWELHRR